MGAALHVEGLLTRLSSGVPRKARRLLGNLFAAPLNPATAAQEVGDVCFGSVFPSSSKRANELRASTLASGFPEHVPAYTVNRWVQACPDSAVKEAVAGRSCTAAVREAALACSPRLRPPLPPHRPIN